MGGKDLWLSLYSDELYRLAEERPNLSPNALSSRASRHAQSAYTEHYAQLADNYREWSKYDL